MYTIKSIDGIIFDMDGVIFDSELIGLESWIKLGDKYGLNDVEKNAKKCIGRSTKDTMAILEDAYGDKVSIQKLYSECKKVFHDIIANGGLPLKKGAVDILKWLHDSGVKVGLASSTAYNTVVSQLTEAGLIDYFNIIVGGDMIEHSKPQPDIYLLACQKLGVSPQNTIAVEDSYNGILAAYSAGMIPVLIPDLIEPNDEMIDKSYIKLDSLTELLQKMSDSGI